MHSLFLEKDPVFSIITPTFRRYDLLRRNVKSVQNQTFKDYEHIIVDDGNDDRTARFIEDTSDKRIIYIKHERSKGAAASYNSGILKSRGYLILFLDDLCVLSGFIIILQILKIE